jgi:hypothetical protein
MTIQDFSHELFGLLKSRLEELGFDTEAVTDMPEGGRQIGGTLLFALPVTEDNDRVLTDLRLLAVDEERYCIQIYITVFTGLREGYAELQKLLPALNYHEMLGAYGILEAEREFFHKYSLPLRELDLIDGALGFALALLDTLDLIREQNTVLYPLAAALASGRLTYGEALQNGIVRPL